MCNFPSWGGLCILQYACYIIFISSPLYNIHICCLVFLLVLPRLSLIVLNKIIAAIYIFLYQDIQDKWYNCPLQPVTVGADATVCNELYSVLGWSGLTLFCDFNNLRCTHFCRSGIFYQFNSKKIGNFNRVQCASITYCTMYIVFNQSFHCQKIKGTLKMNILFENLQITIAQKSFLIKMFLFSCPWQIFYYMNRTMGKQY